MLCFCDTFLIVWILPCIYCLLSLKYQQNQTPKKHCLKKKKAKTKKQEEEEVGAEEISYSEINVIRSFILL